MPVVIRKARAEDARTLSALNADIQAVHAAALPALFKEARADMFLRAGVADLIDHPDNILLVAEADGIAAGYVYAQLVRFPETSFQQAHDMVYLHHIGVRPDHRRKGVGGALIAALRAEARANGIDVITLDAWTFNDAARTFFARHGFSACSVKMWNRDA